MKRLLALKIDINARYANDLTLLMWASGPDEKVSEAQAIKVVSYLLDAGAQIDDRDARGRTALMIAAEGGRAEIANLLLAHGADPSLKDKAGKRAADLTVLSSLRERHHVDARAPLIATCRSPDGAQRNPGPWHPQRGSPDCAALHPGYGLRVTS